MISHHQANDMCLLTTLFTDAVIETKEGGGLFGVAFSPSVANQMARPLWIGWYSKLIDIRHPNQYYLFCLLTI